jgi:hypothetical protein
VKIKLFLGSVFSCFFLGRILFVSHVAKIIVAS